MKYEHICDYGWLAKGRKYWNIRQGNPYCAGLYKFPISITKDEVIKEMHLQNEREKIRFTHHFPGVKWEVKA